MVKFDTDSEMWWQVRLRFTLTTVPVLCMRDNVITPSAKILYSGYFSQGGRGYFSCVFHRQITSINICIQKMSACINCLSVRSMCILVVLQHVSGTMRVQNSEDLLSSTIQLGAVRDSQKCVIVLESPSCGHLTQL